MRIAILLFASGLAAVTAEPADQDTVIHYDSGISTIWWCSDRDSFGAGVRFTPGEYPCEVIGARAEVNHDAGGREIYLRVWDDDGPDGKPGTVLYDELRLDIPPNRTPGWQDYLLTEVVRVDEGNFYIVFWQRSPWDLVFSSDEAMTWPARQWWYFPDQGWVTPYGMHASDHLVRALVRYGSGVAEEPGGQLPPRLVVVPNPVTAGRAELVLPDSDAGPVAAVLCDVAGRVVRRFDLAPAARRLDLRGLAPGVYLVRAAAGAHSTRLVIAD
ncbi:MAG: T9SS type A sorting domain-containing protein [bacterium]